MVTDDIRELIEQLEAEYQRKVAKLPRMLGFKHLELTNIGRFQRGDHQLNLLLGVPVHVLHALRQLLMRLRTGGGEDDHA